MKTREKVLIAAVLVLSGLVVTDRISPPQPQRPIASLVQRLARFFVWTAFEPAPQPQARSADFVPSNEPVRYAVDANGVAVVNHGAGW